MKDHNSKKYLIMLVAVLMIVMQSARGQGASGLNYQAMALDSSGNALQNQTVRLRFGIVELSTSGPIIFQESHLTTTDDKGIFSLQIGKGVAELNTLDSVNWENRPVYLKVEMDESGGVNYSFIGFVEFASVPYAFRAAYGPDEDADPDNEIQQLSLSGDSLRISGGNSILLPAVADDFGNHTASQNLKLGSFWLSGDGDDEGVKIDSDGTVNAERLRLAGISTLFADQRNNLGFSLPLDTGTTANDNVLLGIESGNQAMTGSENTLLGYRAGQNITTGNGNVFLGTKAGNMNNVGRNNVAIGVKAAELNETGYDNVMVGNEAGSQTTGAFNTFLGASAGVSLQGGLGNVFLGGRAGFNNQSGSLNVFIGSRAGSDEMGSERLYIENTPSSSPLIYGEFDNDLVRVNGDLDVTGDITVAGNKIDADSTNELQTLSLSGDTLSISGGNSVMISGASSQLKVDIGTITWSNTLTNPTLTIPHNLGAIPSLVDVFWLSLVGPFQSWGTGQYNGSSHTSLTRYGGTAIASGTSVDNGAIIRVTNSNNSDYLRIKVIEMTSTHVTFKVNQPTPYNFTFDLNWKFFR